LFNPSKRARRLVAADETILKINGNVCYLGAATDMDARDWFYYTGSAKTL
jgi:transposase-like protein